MKRFNPLMLVLLGVLLMLTVFTGCKDCKTDHDCNEDCDHGDCDQKEETDMAAGQIMEIAVRQVKDGQMDEFIAARSAFIKLLKEQPCIIADAEFKSVSSLGTDFAPVAVDNVYVGMTVYESAEAYENAGKVLMRLLEAGAFFETFDMLAFLQVVPLDGKPIELDKIIAESGQCMEFPVRKIRDMESFEKYLPTVVEILMDSKGFIGNREFASINDDTTVGMVSWESNESVDAAIGAFLSHPDVPKFFGSFEMVTFQRLIRTTN
ncbi:hypothetical protein K8R78_00990 [bacterium]|nr:hypothetical protein [bacterium]